PEPGSSDRGGNPRQSRDVEFPTLPARRGHARLGVGDTRDVRRNVMPRKLLATTALSLLFAGGAFAQDLIQPAPMVPTDPAATEAPAQELVTAAETGINSDGWLATEIIGSTLYTSAAEDAESIGDVNDFVLDGNGSVAAV